MSFPFAASPNSSWTGSTWTTEEEAAALAEGATAGPVGSVHTTIVNDTELPDTVVHEAAAHWMTETFFQENASLAGAQSTFQTYVNDGSLLARHRYRTPTNVIEEMKLARDLAERDDDIRAIIGGVLGLAFDKVELFAKDQKTLDLFREMSKPRRMNLRHLCKEMLREYYITTTITTVKLFVPDVLQYRDDNAKGEYLASPTKTPVRVLTPRVGVLPGENIRVVGSDLFGDHALAYWPGDDPKLSKFLEEYFSDKTTAARKREMQREDPVSTTLFVQPVQVNEQQSFLPGSSFVAYLMNPSMVHRTTMAKGFWPYPRPLLAAVFHLLEAKRLLNIMDFALLQGAANYVVVAKKGSDARPALPNEIVQLRELVRHLGRTGVVVGDHRLSFDILTPKLDDLLVAEKRDLISKHIATALLRKPPNITQDGGAALAQTEGEWITRVIEDDRKDVLEHLHHFVFHDTVDANPMVLKEPPELHCNRILLGGSTWFTDFVLKLRDRGDIPRKYAVEAAGFDFGAAVAERKREVDAGIDDIMLPAEVPYTVPGSVADKGAGPDPNVHSKGTPQDNSDGRPNGAKTGSTTIDPARKPRTISRNAGETVKAWRENRVGEPYRMGELTRDLLRQYDDTAKEGRLTKRERELVAAGEYANSGGIVFIPVNEDYAVQEVTVVRLSQGLSAYIGYRADSAIVAKGYGFRTDTYDELTAQEMAMAWGYPINEEDGDDGGAGLAGE